MPTVLRQASLRFVIWLNDHPPPHVHVFSADAEATIELGSPDAYPRLVANQGMTRRDLAIALRTVLDHQVLLRERWTATHG